MANAFTIAQARLSLTPELTIREEIRTHTGSDEEVSSILRSIERFDGDASIGHYEITPVSRRGRIAGVSVGWNVRAIRR